MSKCFAERCSSILLLPPSTRQCARPAALSTRRCQHQQQQRQRAMVMAMRRRGFSTFPASREDSRIRDIGRDISDDYAVIRDHYRNQPPSPPSPSFPNPSPHPLNPSRGPLYSVR